MPTAATTAITPTGETPASARWGSGSRTAGAAGMHGARRLAASPPRRLADRYASGRGASSFELGDVPVEVVLDEQVATHVIAAVGRAAEHVRGHRLGEQLERHDEHHGREH